jgi:hypothetical protein
LFFDVQPTLVVHGHRDIMLPPMNAFVLSQHIPNAQLIIYPKSGHGALFQYSTLLCSIRECFSMLDSPSPYTKEGNRLAGPIAVEPSCPMIRGFGKCRKFSTC